MTRLLRDFRLIPIVLVAAICLFVLKTLGLVFDGGYTLGDLAGRDVGDASDITGTVAAPKPAKPAAAPPPNPAPQSWAHRMFNYPEVTGSVGNSKTAPQQKKAAVRADAAKTKQEQPKSTAGWTAVPLGGERQPSPAERAILERLHERRTELDAQAREIEARENLLKAAEKRLQERIGELKELEARINNAVQQQEEGEAARFKNLITMYENMKAKDAAKIFDRLGIEVLVEVATQVNPRRMSEILAQMSPQAAERLTVVLANHGKAKELKDKPQPAELPKIEGQPTSN